jgi:Holliday junction resolvase RusA-like endonuclease
MIFEKNNIISQLDIFVDNFKLKPYVRQTRRGKFVKKNAIEYNENQMTLAWEIKAKYNKVYFEKKFLFCIYKINLKKIVPQADWDNYVKAAQDGLVKSGIIADDNVNNIFGGMGYVIPADKNSLEISILNLKKRKLLL